MLSGSSFGSSGYVNELDEDPAVKEAAEVLARIEELAKSSIWDETDGSGEPRPSSARIRGDLPGEYRTGQPLYNGAKL
jgi:hypothetical protein